ncbi:hypothetical protein SDC9_181342 [bioreactor metagenome]|uniref:Uncharacterized protein n=1 Tax=bioreactor metagenome TaxID=1076179 RepID=A0A645H578_9ZZZZ
MHQGHGQLAIGVARGNERDQRLAAIGLQTRKSTLDFRHSGIPRCGPSATTRCSLELDARTLGDSMHVLVAPTGQIHQQDTILGQSRCQLGCVGQRMR